MSQPLPTLSGAGFISGIAQKADRALTYAFTTDGAQSVTYEGNIVSIPSLVAECQGDMLLLASRARDVLERYFSRIFDAAVIETVAELVDESTSNSKYNLKIRIRVSDGGVAYSLAREIPFEDSKFAKIIEFNNTGNL